MLHQAVRGAQFKRLLLGSLLHLQQKFAFWALADVYIVAVDGRSCRHTGPGPKDSFTPFRLGVARQYVRRPIVAIDIDVAGCCLAGGVLDGPPADQRMIRQLQRHINYIVAEILQLFLSESRFLFEGFHTFPFLGAGRMGKLLSLGGTSHYNYGKQLRHSIIIASHK